MFHYFDATSTWTNFFFVKNCFERIEMYTEIVWQNFKFSLTHTHICCPWWWWWWCYIWPVLYKYTSITIENKRTNYILLDKEIYETSLIIMMEWVHYRRLKWIQWMKKKNEAPNGTIIINIIMMIIKHTKHFIHFS